MLFGRCERFFFFLSFFGACDVFGQIRFESANTKGIKWINEKELSNSQIDRIRQFNVQEKDVNNWIGLNREPQIFRTFPYKITDVKEPITSLDLKPIPKELIIDKDELIGKQQLEIEDYKMITKHNREVRDKLKMKFYAIGQPLNDNVLQFNKKLNHFRTSLYSDEHTPTGTKIEC